MTAHPSLPPAPPEGETTTDGQWTSPRVSCPKCGAHCLTDRDGLVEWCSLAGCDYGIGSPPAPASAPPEGAEGLLDRLRARLAMTFGNGGASVATNDLRLAIEVLATLTARVRALDAATGLANVLLNQEEAERADAEAMYERTAAELLRVAEDCEGYATRLLAAEARVRELEDTLIANAAHAGNELLEAHMAYEVVLQRERALRVMLSQIEPPAAGGQLAAAARAVVEEYEKDGTDREILCGLGYRIPDLADALARLTEAQAVGGRDTERLDWMTANRVTLRLMRDHDWYWAVVVDGNHVTEADRDDLRDAIDAAREAGR